MVDLENSLVGNTRIDALMLLWKDNQISCKQSCFVHDSAQKQKQVL